MAGITFQNDNWLGDAINGLDVGPSHNAKILMTAEQIKLLRLKQQAEQQALDEANRRLKGVDDTTAAYARTLSPYGPTTDFGLNIPSEDSQSIEPLNIDIPQSWTDPQGAQDYANRRDLAIKMFRQGSLLGKSAKDYAEGMPYLTAQNRVAVGGVPDDSSQRDALEFMTTGKFSPDKKPSNYVITDANGQVIGKGASSDMRTDVAGQRIVVPPGANLQVAGAADANPNIYGDQKAALQAFATIAQKANNGIPITEDEVQRARILRDTAFPQSIAQVNEGGRNVTRMQRTAPIPDWGGRLSTLIDDYGAGKHLQPAPPIASAVPYVTGAGAPSASAVAAAPPPAAAPATPAGVLPANVPQEISRGAANPAELRKEIAGTQAYSDYVTAVPAYNTVVEAAKAPPTNATDLNIIYGIAKLFDPGSVVREGELKLASSTGTIGEQLSAIYSRLFADKGTLSPETRANLIEQGRIRMRQYASAWENQRDFYSGRVAPSVGLNPADVVPPVPPMAEFNRSELTGRTPQAAAMPTRARPAAAPAGAVDHDAVKAILGMQ